MTVSPLNIILGLTPFRDSRFGQRARRLYWRVLPKNPEVINDYAFCAIHVEAVIGKQIIQAYYRLLQTAPPQILLSPWGHLILVRTPTLS